MHAVRAPRSAVAAIIAAVLPLLAHAQASQSFDKALESLARELAASPGAAKPIRVAFLPFAAQGKTSKEDTGFGSFAADQLAIRTKDASAKIRVFERSRLSDILDENELSLSGLIDADQAMQVGGLAPVDALVTGSYAADSSAVTLTLRLVSVVTGEVLYSGTARSAIDGGAAAFFGPGKGADAVPVDRVKAALEEMEALLADISTGEKLAKAAAKAASYPLFGEYAKVHSLCCETFRRYGAFDPRYRAFLLDSLGRAGLISADGDTYLLVDVVRYLGSDGCDDAEFRALLDAASVMTAVGYYNVVLGYAFKGGTESQPLPAAVVDARVDAVMARAQAGKLGRPMAADPGLCLEELLGALGKDGRAIERAYRLNARLVKGKELEPNLSALKRAFSGADDEPVKRALLSLIAGNYAAQDSSGAPASRVWDYARDLENEEGYGDAWAREFARLIPVLLSKAILATDYSKEERIHFCLRYGIDAPGLVPSLADMERELSYGETIREKREAAAMLIALGPRAAKAEGSVQRTLRFIRDKSIDGMGAPNLQMECYAILSALPGPKPESLALIALGLDHSYQDVREAAGDAFEKIGPPALPALADRPGGEAQTGIPDAAPGAHGETGGRARPRSRESRRGREGRVHEGPDARGAFENEVTEGGLLILFSLTKPMKSSYPLFFLDKRGKDLYGSRTERPAGRSAPRHTNTPRRSPPCRKPRT